MRTEALYINGVWGNILDEIVTIQERLPHEILFLQPLSSAPIVYLRDNRPAGSDPVQLFVSTTRDLQNVCYQAEIVGWEDKTVMSPDRREFVEARLRQYQEEEQRRFVWLGGHRRRHQQKPDIGQADETTSPTIWR